MATSIRRLVIKIDQEGNAKKGISSISDAFKALPTPVGLAITAIAAVGAATVVTGAKLISLGSDAEEMVGKFNVVFGTSAPEAIAALDEFGNVVGRSKFELMEMAATVQDTFVPLGFARDEAAGMSVELSKLAVDMGSFNNVADAEVMRDLQSAIVGNHETMRKYGVIITQATLKQELLRMGVEGGIAAASEQEKVQARLNLIMAGTTDAQGDATRTAGSWANQMRALKSTLSEAATTIGLELLPFVTPLLKLITDLARTALPPLINTFKELMSHLREQLGPAIREIFAAFQEIFEELGIGVGDVDWLKVAITGLKIVITSVAGVMRSFASVLRTVAGAIRTVGRAIDWVVRKWDRMKRAARDAVRAIPGWLRPGSPTPFEQGLRGIGKAMDAIDFGKLAPPPGVMGGTPGAVGGGSVVVNLAYSPLISLADRYEAEERLAPFIADELRKQGVIVG